MPVQDVDRVHALAPHLGVEVEAAAADAAGAQDFVDCQREVFHAVGKLVGVPAVLRVAAVGVYAAENPERGGGRDLVLEAVSRQRGVVGLDVQLDVLFEVELPEEAIHGGTVEVVLVFGRLQRLGLDQQLPLEADLVLVVHHHLHEAAQLPALAQQVGVEQGVITFAAAPHHIVGAAQLLRGVERAEHLRRRVGENFGIRVARRAGRVTRMAEQVGRSPQQRNPGLFLFLGEHVHHGRQVAAVLGQVHAFRRHVRVMKGVEGHTQPGNQREGRVGLFSRLRQLVPAGVPVPFKGSLPEDVAAGPHKDVPVADREPQVLLHGLAQHAFAGIVMTIPCTLR
eukprot:Opistho-1_new@48096